MDQTYCWMNSGQNGHTGREGGGQERCLEVQDGVSKNEWTVALTTIRKACRQSRSEDAVDHLAPVIISACMIRLDWGGEIRPTTSVDFRNPRFSTVALHIYHTKVQHRIMSVTTPLHELTPLQVDRATERTSSAHTNELQYKAVAKVKTFNMTTPAVMSLFLESW